MTDRKIGKKDPCPCGSGKKYKRCCLEKDQAAGRQLLRTPPAPIPLTAPTPAKAATPVVPARDVPQALPRLPLQSVAPPQELTPDEKWWEDFAERYAAAESSADVLELLRGVLADAPPIDEESILEYLSPPLHQLADAGLHADVMAIVDALAARFAAEIGPKNAYFERLRFQSALARADVDLVAEARRFGPHVAKIIDLVPDLPLRLAWEGRVAALRALTDAAWLPIVARTDLMISALDEWGGFGVGGVLLDHLERRPDVTMNDPGLLADVAPFEEGADAGAIVAYAQRWLTLIDRPGDLPLDLSISGPKREGDDMATFQQLENLTAVVVSRLRAEEGWSRSRGWLFLQEMPSLLTRCAVPGKGQKGQKGQKAQKAHFWLPSPSELHANLLRRNLGMFAHRMHTIASVIEALPAWTREIVAREWASPAVADRWLRESMALFRKTFLEIPERRRDAIERELLDFTQARS